MNDLFINYLMNQLTQTSHIHTHTHTTTAIHANNIVEHNVHNI